LNVTSTVATVFLGNWKRSADSGCIACQSSTSQPITAQRTCCYVTAGAAAALQRA